MTSKKIVIHLSGPSCSGKSTVMNSIAEKFPDIYLVSYDKQKWQLAGYHRDKHQPLIKAITLGLFEIVCQKSIPIQLDFFCKNKNEYARCRAIAKKYGYEFITIGLTAPDKVLIDRFRERVKNAKLKGTKISVTDEKLFVKNLSMKFFVPKGTPIFDTSKTKAGYIADEIIKLLPRK